MTRAAWAAELVGDLAVAYADHATRPPPPRETASLIPSAARFEHWRPLLRLAIEAGIAVAAAAAHPEDALRALADVVRADPRLLAELRDALIATFSDMEYEYGFVFGAISWDQACTVRSALVFLQELSGAPLDLARVDHAFARWSDELFSPPLDLPAGIPASHWWWFRSQP